MSICSVHTIVSVRSPKKSTKPKPNIMKHMIAEEAQPSTTDKKSLGSMMNLVYVTGLTNNNNIAYSETNKSFNVANSQVINNSKMAYSKAGAAYSNEDSKCMKVNENSKLACANAFGSSICKACVVHIPGQEEDGHKSATCSTTYSVSKTVKTKKKIR